MKYSVCTRTHTKMPLPYGKGFFMAKVKVDWKRL